VIWFEGYTVRNSDGQVCKHSTQLVVLSRFEAKVVAQFVDGKE
jgi:hypothetical protein